MSLLRLNYLVIKQQSIIENFTIFWDTLLIHLNTLFQEVPVSSHLVTKEWPTISAHMQTHLSHGVPLRYPLMDLLSPTCGETVTWVRPHLAKLNLSQSHHALQLLVSSVSSHSDTRELCTHSAPVLTSPSHGAQQASQLQVIIKNISNKMVMSRGSQTQLV